MRRRRSRAAAASAPSAGGSVLWERTTAGELLMFELAAGNARIPRPVWRTTLQIFCDDAGDYYELRKDVPHHARADAISSRA
jgi:hypothetical protein